MNIIEMLEDVDLNKELDALIDKLVLHRLKRDRLVCIEEYEKVTAGIPVDAYELDDLEEDAFQISLRISSYDMILCDCDESHVAYDFYEDGYAEEKK